MRIAINIDVSAMDFLGIELMRVTHEAADRATAALANRVHQRWLNAIQNAKLSDAEKHDYANTLTVTRVNSCDYLVSSDYRKAVEIETGRPLRDLKQMLQTSLKTRRTKDGRKYLCIPFRHGTPKTTVLTPMPKAIYDDYASKMGPSIVQRMSTRLSATGHTVPQSVTLWDKKGNEFTTGKGRNKKTHLSIGALPAGLAPKLAPHHATDIYAGMRKVLDAPSDKAAGYLTWRRMIEGQTGWIVPAKPGLFLVQGMIDNMHQDESKTEDYLNSLLSSAIG
jgi:hypothetical protein